TEPAAGVPQRGRGDFNQRQPHQGAGELAPYLAIPAILEQGRVWQQVDHAPHGQLPQPLLDPSALGKLGIDQFERNDPRAVRETSRTMLRAPAVSVTPSTLSSVAVMPLLGR